MGLSPYGCVRMLAELLLGHQTPCMLPKSFSGVGAGRLRWALWSTMGERMGPWRRLGIRTPYAPYGGGGSYIGRGTVTCDQKLF
jgi:hypothetical protein